MGVSDNIRRLRIEAGLTQEELAAKLGVARSTITQWERGWSHPRMGMVKKLAQVLGTTASIIVSEDERPLGPGSGASLEAAATVPLFAMGEPIAGSPTALVDVGRCVEVPASVLRKHPSARAIFVDDDGMDRVASPGQIAIYDPDLLPANGQIALVNAPGQPILMRRWYRGGTTVMLVADSHASHEDVLVATSEPLQVLGTVVWVQSARLLP